MQAFKFMKYDFRSTKRYVMFIIPMFMCVAYLLSNTSGFGIVYMIFGGIIFSTQPFALAKRSEYGFVDMLPGSRADRITGRFLFGAALQLICALGAVIVQCLLVMTGKAGVDDYISLLFFSLSAGLFVVALQYLCLYILGDLLGVQLMSIVRIVPGFIVFFVGTALIGLYSDGKHAEVIDKMTFAAANNMEKISIAVLVISIIIFYVSIRASIVITRNRDYIA